MISGFDRSMFDSQKKPLDCSVCFSFACTFEAAKQPGSPGKRRKKKTVCHHLPFDTAGGFSPSDLTWMCRFVFRDWQARGERFGGGCGANTRVCLDPLGMLPALKGQRGKDGGFGLR